jgi:hypothetical protein
VHLWSSILLVGDVELVGECVVLEVGIFVDFFVQGIDLFEKDSYFEWRRPFVLRQQTYAVLTYSLTSSEAPQIGLGSPHI